VPAQSDQLPITPLMQRCQDVQMLKFGTHIDLAILEKVCRVGRSTAALLTLRPLSPRDLQAGEDEGTAELKQKLKSCVRCAFICSCSDPSWFRLERSSTQKLGQWDEKIQAAKDELAEVPRHSYAVACRISPKLCRWLSLQITQQNTRWLERVAALTKAQYDLEDQLNTSTKNVHVRRGRGARIAASLIHSCCRVRVQRWRTRHRSTTALMRKGGNSCSWCSSKRRRSTASRPRSTFSDAKEAMCLCWHERLCELRELLTPFKI
jgi:hypothetical protein